MTKVGITERGDAAFHLDKLIKINDKYDACIWITKRCSAIDKVPEEVIVHCTITGWGGSIIEPGVNSSGIELNVYHRLVNQYGGDRIVLRVDPIILTDLGIDYAKKMISQARGRVRISFLDLYPHVKRRFEKLGFEYPIKTFHADLSLRKSYLELFQTFTYFEIEVCGEPGLSCTGCISARDIGDYKSAGKSQQRKDCHCIAEKVELLNDRKQCVHGCAYCYWK